MKGAMRMDRWTISMRAEKGRPSPYWGALTHGMLMERLPEAWQARLHGDGPRPLSQWVEPGDGACFLWHLNVLDDALAGLVAPLLEEGARWRCRHLEGDFTVERATRESLTPQAYTKPFFLGEAAPRLRMSFLTTTTHKAQGGYALFPSVELIAGALRRRLCDVAPDIVLSDDEVLEQIVARTRIARYRLQSGSFALEGARVQGYTGHVDLSVHGPDPLIRLADMLFCFAPWCGVGIKTALGMGACRVEKIDLKGDK